MKGMISRKDDPMQVQTADTSSVIKTIDKQNDDQLRLSDTAHHRNHLMTDHLIKLTMFLCVTLLAFSQNILNVNCQIYHQHHQRNPQQQSFEPSQNHASNRQSRLHQIVRSPREQPPNFIEPTFTHHRFRQEAERRASSSQVNQQQQQQADNQGKVLVCYYTTRGQSAPYWPSDTSGYVIPTDQLGGENMLPSELTSSGAQPAMELRQESGFAPIVAAGPQKNGFVAQQQQSQQRSTSNNHQQQQLDPQSYSYAKNQQQQLVFKSSINAHQPIMMMPPPGNQQAFASNSNNNGLAQKNRKQSHSQEYQDAFSQLLGKEQANQHAYSGNSNNILQQQQTLIFASKNGGKQGTVVPAYSLVGNGESESATNHGGLIVGGQPPALSGIIGGFGGNNGDNGGFIISSGSANNGNHQQEKTSTKQLQQQLVFHQPPTSRAFSSAGANNNNNNNNEVLDTKSQLFNSHNNNNNIKYLHQYQQNHQQQTNTPLHQQLPVPMAERQKGKSLQSLATSGSEHQQMSPMMQQVSAEFSGAVTSTPPVPLSQASASAAASQQYATTTTSAAAGTTYRTSSMQQSNFSPGPNMNQLIVGNGGGGEGGQTTQKSQSTAATSALASTLSPTKLPCQAGECSSAAAKQSMAASSRGSAGAPTSLPVASGPTQQQQQQQQHQQVASLSSALVSSPLSTMFDVFGAASQYLMRFKPSSLISPSSFVFNTIQSDNHHGLKTSNSSLLGSFASHAGGASSMIPLPYVPANIIAQQVAKSASSLTSSQAVNSQGAVAVAAANAPLSSDGENSGDSSWSRFSLQNSQQRREDVCGRTIQTPQRRIIGGEGARYGEFPYQVHIKIAKHQCGGALVDRQSIVTAAHCVYHFITRAPVNKLQIVIGAYDIEDEQYQELPPQYFKVNKVKLHPNFRFSASHPDRYDIAILKLDKPVKYTDNVLPVCLPSKDIKYESLVGTVTGFGKTDPSLSNRYGTRLLQKVDVPIIENNECERWHRTRGIDLKIFPEMMCAGYEDGLKDACVGDSGGPLVVKTAAGPNGSFRWTLAGITSAGFGCAQSRQPGIYHRVSHTVDWILENLD